MSGETVILGGRYHLGRILGTGGMAEVFLAEDTRLHRTVAVKVLRSDLARDANFQERFRREAHSAASLNHPSIVAVYDTGEEQQTTITGSEVTIPYIVMEYVEGRTLREYIDPEHPMDVIQAGEIMAALLSALEYSHRAGIVHRDIKPGNIMINSAGAVKVMDFGIARAVADATSAMTATQAVMGTAQYLSPEQARGQLVDARSDIYSAACVMFEMLTGRPPFTGDTPVSIAYQHVREDPQPPSAYNPAVTPALDAVILTGLAKDREQRYPSAVAFSRDIAAVVAGRAPALVAGALPGHDDPEATTVLSPLDDATEALPATAGALGAGAAGAAAMRPQDWRTGSAPSPATGPLALRSGDEVEPEEKREAQAAVVADRPGDPRGPGPDRRGAGRPPAVEGAGSRDGPRARRGGADGGGCTRLPRRGRTHAHLRAGRVLRRRAGSRDRDRSAREPGGHGGLHGDRHGLGRTGGRRGPGHRREVP